MNKDLIKKAIELIKNGKTVRDTSRILEINRETLRYYLKKDKIKSVFKQGCRPCDFISKHFKNKTFNGKGYILIKCRNHPNTTKQGYIQEHRLVMEKHIGRYLTKDEDVHHINGNKQDNRIENLELILHSKHSSKTIKKQWKDGNIGCKFWKKTKWVKEK